MTSYTDKLTAEQLIRYIANDYMELSHDKVVWQRNDHMKACRDWLLANIKEDKFAETLRKARGTIDPDIDLDF